MNKKDYERAFVDAVIPILTERLPPDVYEKTELTPGNDVLEIGGWRYKQILRLGGGVSPGEMIEYSIKRCDGYYGEGAYLQYYPPGTKMSGQETPGHPGWKVDSVIPFKRYKGRTRFKQRVYGRCGPIRIFDSYIPTA